MTSPSAAEKTKSKQSEPASGAGAPTDTVSGQLRAGGAPSTIGPDGEKMTNAQLLRWMFQFLSPVKPLVAIACIYFAAYDALEVVTVSLTKNAVDHMQQLHALGPVAQNGFFHWLWHGENARFSLGPILHEIYHHSPSTSLRDIFIALTGLMALLLLFRYLREVGNTKLSMTLVFYIREAMYDKLQRVGFGFHDTLNSGQLINRALTDLQNIRQFIQTAVLTTLDIVLIVSFYMIFIMFIDPWLLLITVPVLPVWTWYVLRFSRKIQPVNQEVMESGDKDVSIITESIAGVHVIKAFATEQQEIEKYGNNINLYFARVIKRITMFADFTPIIRAIATVSYLALFWAVGLLVIHGTLHAGDFLAMGIAMGAILTRLQQVATINEQYQNAIVSAWRVYEVLMAPPTVPESATARPLPPGPGSVRFEHVTFGYAPDKPVLRDVSFDVKGGSIVAIVGPTGAGKSSLVNLLARFYDPQSGRILIDGMDTRDTTLASLRTQVGFVFQETYLFSDTVAANIAYGRPGITHGETEAAARLAQAHEFIDTMPKQYETVLAERGASLSGGQKQRLAIARAILSNPRILVLDDATAAVDPETEDMIRQAMRFVMYGRTTFVIAHRISTAKRADMVIVLENGRITQVGTHEKLMNERGHYREIASVQLYRDEPRDQSEHPSHMKRAADPREFARIGIPADPAPRMDDTTGGGK